MDKTLRRSKRKTTAAAVTPQKRKYCGIENDNKKNKIKKQLKVEG